MPISTSRSSVRASCQSSSRCSAITASVCSARPVGDAHSVSAGFAPEQRRAAPAPSRRPARSRRGSAAYADASPCSRRAALNTVSPCRAMKSRPCVAIGSGPCGCIAAFNPLWRKSNGFPRLSEVHATSRRDCPFAPSAAAFGAAQTQWSISMRKLILAAAAAAAALAAPAFAQDATRAFTGPRVEAIARLRPHRRRQQRSNDNGRDDQKIDGVALRRRRSATTSQVGGVGARRRRRDHRLDRARPRPQRPYQRLRLRPRHAGPRPLCRRAASAIVVAPTHDALRQGRLHQRAARDALRSGSTSQTTDTSSTSTASASARASSRRWARTAYAKVEYRYSNYERATSTMRPAHQRPIRRRHRPPSGRRRARLPLLSR